MVFDEFEEFIRDELASGGPDPQIPTILALAAPELVAPYTAEGQQERVWMAGCYCSHHCVPSAYAVYTSWTPEMVLERPGYFKNWLKDNWDYLPVRPEMRSHRMLEKRHECLSDFAWLATQHETLKSIEDFEIAYQYVIANVKYFGRYMAIKFMEIGRQGGFLSVKMPDMRARGGWSPRMAMSMLYPDDTQLADRNDSSKSGDELMEQRSLETLAELRHRGIDLNFFQLQVLLCEFKEFVQETYYPGASLDEEIDYIKKAERRFNMAGVWEVRSELFKPEYLGEKEWPS